MMEEGKRKEYEDHPVAVGEQSCKIKSHSHSKFTFMYADDRKLKFNLQWVWDFIGTVNGSDIVSSGVVEDGIEVTNLDHWTSIEPERT